MIVDLRSPFGGFKKSGIGRELGPEGLAGYTEYQSIILPAAPNGHPTGGIPCPTACSSTSTAAGSSPTEARPFDVIDPATEESIGAHRARRRRRTSTRPSPRRAARVRDLLADHARGAAGAAAAHRRPPTRSATTRSPKTISQEMGAPFWLSKAAQAAHRARPPERRRSRCSSSYEFEELRGTTLIRREPIGVCGFITPWNWPRQPDHVQGRAGAGGGLHDGAEADRDRAAERAILVAEILHEAGVPAGVFNLVNGDGPTRRARRSPSHPGIDMVSFTGSTRAGILVAKAAADTVKRVTQELGGKSAEHHPRRRRPRRRPSAAACMSCVMNSGQSCNAPTRMLVPADAARPGRRDRQGASPRASRSATRSREGTRIGPVVSETQWKKIQGLIQKGIDEGATLVTGGPGRPRGPRAAATTCARRSSPTCATT